MAAKDVKFGADAREPLRCRPARRIILDVDVDALADPERVGFAPVSAQLLPDHLDLFGELIRRLRATHASAASAGPEEAAA